MSGLEDENQSEHRFTVWAGGDLMKQQKYTNFEKAQANSLENNIGGFTDPELWEKIKKLHGGIVPDNMWTVWGDYWKALGKVGSERHGKFEVDYKYTNEGVGELVQ